MKSWFFVFYKSLIRPFIKVMIIIAAISAVILLMDQSREDEHHLKKRLMLLQFNDSPLSELPKKGIIEGLARNGYILGKDYELKISNAQGDIATLNLMVDVAVNDRPDLIFLTSTPTLQSAVKKIRNTPVVFTVVADPILAGAGTTFNNHLPNFTGISTLGDYPGMIRWVKTLKPTTKVIGTLFSPGELNSVTNMEELRKFAGQAGIKLLAVPVNSSQEITDAALALTGQKPDIICQIVDNLTSLSSGTIIRISTEKKIPVFGFVSDQIKMGAVLVVSRDYYQAGIDAVKLAVKVLNGESPSAIPFEYVSKTNVLINPDAAASFNINITPDILKRTDITIIK